VSCRLRCRTLPWILEASKIYLPTKKALHLCKALIFLVFLAPRPGLEPGTYGLTGWASIPSLARMNPHFSGFAFPILLGRFAERRHRMCPDRPLDIGSIHGASSHLSHRWIRAPSRMRSQVLAARCPKPLRLDSQTLGPIRPSCSTNFCRNSSRRMGGRRPSSWLLRKLPLPVDT